MQKEGNATWGANGEHSWCVWPVGGVWHWEVLGPRGPMERAEAASKGDAFIALRQCLLRRGESV